MAIGRVTGCLVIAAALLALCGCKSAQMASIAPQSHFVYPNSNIKALGPVKATYTTDSGFGYVLPNADDEAKLYSMALTQVEGADLIVDYVQTFTIYTFPILPITWAKMEIEGTAAKMEVGKQRLQ